MTTPLITADWLNQNLDNPEIVILDASAKTDALKKQIKGTRFFDLKEDFRNKDSKFPNTMPPKLQFEVNCRKLGINNSSHIVVYDDKGIYFSPRVWWLFKTMGHEKVSVLDGGFPEWHRKGYATEENASKTFPSGNFEAKFHPEQVREFDFIKSNIEIQQATVIDARSAGRFNGTAPEPRVGLRSGHIPNSVSLPYTNVLHEGKLKPPEALAALFADLNIKNEPLVFSCGSGITACILMLASEEVLNNKKSVYDGSWTEWVLRDDEK